MPLAEAVRTALTAPGKRTRPVFALLCAEHVGGRVEAALDAACAYEMVHAASLIFDDLPCMDDASVRRGQPTLHRRFGEDVATLAGVALLNRAYGVLAESNLPSELVRTLTASLSHAVGLAGLVGGQMRDLRERDGLSADALEQLNHEKTGVLFCAAAEAGALIGGAGPETAVAVRRFAMHVGAAFQIRDDLLDQTDTTLAGKDVGQDAGKVTFVSLLGVEAARRRMADHQAQAAAALHSIGEPGRLGAFSDQLLAVEWLDARPPEPLPA